MWWTSFSLTAAGQPRTFTGFPQAWNHHSKHQHERNVLQCIVSGQTKYGVLNAQAHYRRWTSVE